MANVNGHPAPPGSGNVNHEHSQAAKQIKEFHAKHGEILRAHRAGEQIHPSHVAAYEKARGELKIPNGFDSRLVPPSINFASRSKGVAAAEAAKPNAEAKPERVMNYAEINKPKHLPAERTFTYDKTGGVKETVAPTAPDYAATQRRAAKAGETPETKPQYGKIIQKSKALLEKFSLKKSQETLEKSPGLKQGSKLGHEIYDETANIGRKMTRTGAEATGAGIRAEQTYGGKAGHQTAKDTARNQQKIDDKKNKKQPVKTELPPDLKAQYEAKANTKKSVEADQIPGGLSDKKHDSDFNPKKVAQGSKVESEHTSSPSMSREIAQDHLTEDPKYYDKLSIMEKAKNCLMKMKKSWQVAGEVPSLKKEIGYSDEAKKGAKEVKSKERLQTLQNQPKPKADPKEPEWS